jgi:cobalamin biosynthesis protein CobT
MANSTMNTANTSRNSLLAQLLASEGITVEHRPDAKTAWFELDSRRLVLPQWENKNQSVYDFLVGHEVGHAKYTPADEWKSESIRIGGEGNSMIAKDYINVVEDARIERMIKREFPGLRSDFVAGYKELASMDAFGLQGRDVASLPLVDRINLYYKLGVHTGMVVPFTAEEQVFIDRINAAKTFKDVTDISADLYEFAKQQKKEREEQQGNDGNKGGEGQQGKDRKSGKGEASDGGKEERKETASANGEEDGDSDKSETREGGNEDQSGRSESQEDGEGEEESSGSKSDSAEDANDDGSTADSSDETDEGGNMETEAKQNPDFAPDASSTVSNLEKSMTKFINTHTIEQTITVPQIDASKVVVTANEFVALMDQCKVGRYHGNSIGNDVLAAGGMSKYMDGLALEAFKKMTQENRRAVDLMVKRFDTRRAARNYARQSSAKTGRISTRHLAKYKFSEDIFERITIKNDEKNHGIVILLDWSGSMGGMIQDTVNQLGALLNFCRRVGIPAEVYFFSSVHSKIADELFTKNNPNLNGRKNRDGELISRQNCARWGAVVEGVNWNLHDECFAFTDAVCGLPSGTAGKTAAVYKAFSLIQVYHANMGNKDFARTMGRLLVLSQMVGGGYVSLTNPQSLALGDTPLDESILAMRDIVNNFRKSSNTKVTFISLSDGEGMSIINAVSSNALRDANPTRKVARVMVDASNGRRYAADDGGGHRNTHEIVVQMFKDATNVDIVGVMMAGRLSYCSTFSSACYAQNKKMDYQARREFEQKLVEKFEDDKCISLPYGAYSQYFFVQIVSRMNTEYAQRKEQKKLDNMKNRKVALTRELVAATKRDSANRVFINRLMDIVA